MMTERSFNILRKINANWDEIDKLISDILAADKNNEVDYILISTLSVENGVLLDNFTPIVSCRAFPGDQLYEAVSFRNTIEWIRDDMIPDDGIVLWHREGC